MTTQINKNKDEKSGLGINKFLVLVSGLFGLVLLALMSFGGYYFAYQLPRQQKELFDLEKQNLQLENQRLETEISKLQIENPEPSNTPSPVVSATKSTPAPQTGCNQSKLDGFRKEAIESGVLPEVVDLYIAKLKLNNCQKSTTSSGKADVNVNINGIDEINSKLDKIQNCQQFGICY